MLSNLDFRFFSFYFLWSFLQYISNKLYKIIKKPGPLQLIRCFSNWISLWNIFCSAYDIDCDKTSKNNNHSTGHFYVLQGNLTMCFFFSTNFEDDFILFHSSNNCNYVIAIRFWSWQIMWHTCVEMWSRSRKKKEWIKYLWYICNHTLGTDFHYNEYKHKQGNILG